MLLANLVGTAVVAGATAWTGAFLPDVMKAFAQIGHAAMSHGIAVTFVRGLFAGFLIAAMVWLLPGAGAARLWIVVVIAYFVGLGAFSHIIAGSTEALHVVFSGESTLAGYLTQVLLPTFFGNAIGGVAFVATLAHAQHGPE